MNRGKRTAPVDPNLPVRQTEWNGFTADDMVKVRDESGAKFRFVAYVPAGVDGASKEFVEVFGGRKGKEKMRCINPERIMPLKPVRRRRPQAAAS